MRTRAGLEAGPKVALRRRSHAQVMVNHERLSTLLAHRSTPCVTITLPTAARGPETWEGPLRLKNLLRDVEAVMETDAPAQRDMLGWLRGFLDDADFWAHQRAGLMLLASADEREVWHMPFPLPEQARVDGRFHLKHAIHVANSPAFEVLAFSRGDVRLLDCDASRVRPVPLEGAPGSLEEFLRFDEFEPQLQSHAASSAGAPSSGRPNIIHHGHGGSDERHKEDLERFAGAVASHVDARHAGGGAPPMMVLAATARDAAAFRARSRRGSILEPFIEGNHDRTDDAELRERGWQIVEEVWRSSADEAVERTRGALGAGHGTDTLNGALTAASQGRLSTLVVGATASRSGTFDAMSSRAIVTQESDPRAGDLVDEAACLACMHGADVHVVDDDRVPGGGPLAGILRT